jgi:hypothetical protein
MKRRNEPVEILKRLVVLCRKEPYPLLVAELPFRILPRLTLGDDAVDGDKGGEGGVEVIEEVVVNLLGLATMGDASNPNRKRRGAARLADRSRTRTSACGEGG